MCAAKFQRYIHQSLSQSKESSNIGRALQEFIDDVGVPDSPVCDFASKQTGTHTDVMNLIRQSNIRLHIAEKGRGITQNHRAETEIREIKTKWKTRMRENGVAPRLWDYGLVNIAEIQSLLARGRDQQPGLERITGNTIDISEWLDFDFYDLVWYWDQQTSRSMARHCPSCWKQYGILALDGNRHGNCTFDCTTHNYIRLGHY